MARWGWAAIALLAAACGEGRRPPEVSPVASGVEEPQPAPAAKPAPAEPDAVAKPRGDAARREELLTRKKELEDRIAELERNREEIQVRHAQEREGLPEIDTKTRRRYVQIVRDARAAELKLDRMEQRFEQLRRVAKSGVTGRLKELSEKRDAIERRRAEIENAWQRSLEASQQGKIKESPVKEELDLVRAVKVQWFAASGPARRGAMKSGERWKINEGFRAWLDEVPARKEVVARTLAHPLGPKRETPDNYDFTDLDFYILLELLEDDLDRKNVAVENRELQENRKNLDLIRKELDAVVQEINDSMAEGGSELSEYLDLLGRMPTARESATYLSTRVVEWAQVFRDVDAVRARQAREDEAARAAVKQAGRELSRVELELGRLRR